MTEKRKANRKSSLLYHPLVLLAGFALVICCLPVLYRPDRPVADIVPASSSGPAFVVQIVRPRVSLPLGGIVPPQLFGLDAHIGFDSTSEGATIRSVGHGRIELAADDWELLLLFDSDGGVSSETEVVFDLVFQDRLRRVRCRPGDSVVGTLKTIRLEESGQMSGNFDIELKRCEDAETGVPLGWPPQPLILHGSFDRFPIDPRKQK